MKVLIFTASIGNGHNMAAKSLEQELKRRRHRVHKVDLCAINSRVTRTLLLQGYDMISSKVPLIYKGIYSTGKNPIVGKFNNGIINKIYSQEYLKEVEKFDPDLIIGTHPFSVAVYDYLTKTAQIKLPYLCIVTDFKAHPMYFSEHVDAYITGSNATRLDMVDHGIDERKVYPYGIPLREAFYKAKIEKGTKKENVLNILLLVSGIGSASLTNVLKQLADYGQPIKVNLVCGSQRQLITLEKYFVDKMKKKNQDITVYGFTSRIHELMDEADILISKPGGLTSSEALIKRLPILIPAMIPGQEEENAEFLKKSGVAQVSKYNIQGAIKDLHSHPEKLIQMRENMNSISSKYSLDKIVNLSESLVNQYETMGTKTS